MLHLDIHRGKDSTGVAVVNGQGNWDLVKRKGNAWDLFEVKAFDDVMRYGSNYVYIGHNRAATKGRINNINAHPFEFEDVVGVHNGTIRGQHRLIDNAQFDVDSENIFHSIQEIGLDDTLAVLDGAYALVYWDKRDEELVIVRNNERPMFFCYSEDNRNVFWASEPWILTAALGRFGIKHGEVFNLKDSVIYRFDIERKFNGGPIVTRCREFVPFVPKSTVVYGNQNGGNVTNTYGTHSNNVFKGRINPQEFLQKEVEFTVVGKRTGAAYSVSYIECKEKEEGLTLRLNSFDSTPLIEDMLKNPDILWRGTIRSFGMLNNNHYFNLDPRTIEEVGDDYEDVHLGYQDRMLTEEEWHNKTKTGCAWCSAAPEAEDSLTLMWVSEDTFVCEGCQEQDEVKDYLKQAG